MNKYLSSQQDLSAISSFRAEAGSKMYNFLTILKSKSSYI